MIKLLDVKLGGKLLLVKMPITKTSSKLRRNLVVVKLREALVSLEVVLRTADLKALGGRSGAQSYCADSCCC